MGWTWTAINTGAINTMFSSKDIRPEQKSVVKGNQRHIFRKDCDLCSIPRPQKAQRASCWGSWTPTGFNKTFKKSIIKQVLSLGAIYETSLSAGSNSFCCQVLGNSCNARAFVSATLGSEDFGFKPQLASKSWAIKSLGWMEHPELAGPGEASSSL